MVKNLLHLSPMRTGHEACKTRESVDPFKNKLYQTNRDPFWTGTFKFKCGKTVSPPCSTLVN